MYFLFCRTYMTTELLRHPGDERLRLQVTVAPVPRRPVHMLRMHGDVLVSHQEFICKFVMLMFQIQNILHREWRRAGRTWMHASKVSRNALPDACLKWLMSGGPPQPTSGKDRYISVTSLQPTDQHPACAHFSPYKNTPPWSLMDKINRLRRKNAGQNLQDLWNCSEIRH